MARKPKAPKRVETLTHEEASRTNIPTAEYQSVMKREEQDPVRVAYERRNRDLDPQLVWRGKDEQDWSDLVVQAPPLYIQEKVHPKVLVDDLMRRTEADEKAADLQPDLFADFNGLTGEEATTEFYQHDANWTNRMVLGDSLQVMASFAEREGLRGKVQCIYLDPPYGIKFNSNFQWSTTSRDVKDGKARHITREPEQVKAFRDTWRDGIHSYLTYLRDRLTVARDLLTDSGSIFVQIGDENVHRVRSLMDEVFGDENFISQISFKKTGFQAALNLPNNFDYILWYAKQYDTLKFRRPYMSKLESSAFMGQDVWFDDRVGNRRRLRKDEKEDLTVYDPDNIFRHKPPESAGASSREESIYFRGRVLKPKSGKHFSTHPEGMERLKRADRLLLMGNSLRYLEYLSGYSITPQTNMWHDTVVSGFSDPQIYVVQTSAKVAQRCILMATDPGDLVLDPTCGSGTTAHVAEQWGRRWITADTSRVALALARARIMGARYPYYLLADSREGQVKEAELNRTEPSEATVHGDVRQGFVYERVPHIMLKSIANNAEVDVIWERHEQELAPLREQLSVASGQEATLEEWEIPREKPGHWPQATQPLLTDFWSARIARQKEIDASIAAKADHEYLYDKPYTDNKKVRVAGPFTVESLSPHRVLGVDENDELIDGIAESGNGYGEKQDFPTMVLENLKTSGVQQAHKEDRISFSSITPWPGELVSAEGRFAASEQWFVASDQQEKEPATSHESSATSYKEPATSHESPTTEYRAAIFIGPEFGTVSRPDLVAAAREAGDAGFDALISCAFNYDAHSSEFNKLGRIPVLKARMNADLHMAGDLKNTGKGNLFVIFGEPDISVVSGQWLVDSGGRMVAHYDSVEKLSGLGSLEEINRLGGEDLPRLKRLSSGGEVRTDESDPQSGGLGTGEHRGGRGADGDRGVSAVSERGERIAGGGRDLPDPGGAAGFSGGGGARIPAGAERGDQPHAGRAQAVTAIETLNPVDFPLTLTTNHYTQATVHGVDVFHPNTGEVRSDGAEGIACWFIDTDYNEESFFVRQAYFLGASDPYKSLKTTLKVEINEDAWATLNSDTSRPFDRPESGRIAVKVINHLGDEVMKVFRV